METFLFFSSEATEANSGEEKLDNALNLDRNQKRLLSRDSFDFNSVGEIVYLISIRLSLQWIMNVMKMVVFDFTVAVISCAEQNIKTLRRKLFLEQFCKDEALS